MKLASQMTALDLIQYRATSDEELDRMAEAIHLAADKAGAEATCHAFELQQRFEYETARIIDLLGEYRFWSRVQAFQIFCDLQHFLYGLEGDPIAREMEDELVGKFSWSNRFLDQCYEIQNWGNWFLDEGYDTYWDLFPENQLPEPLSIDHHERECTV